MYRNANSVDAQVGRAGVGTRCLYNYNMVYLPYYNMIYCNIIHARQVGCAGIGARCLRSVSDGRAAGGPPGGGPLDSVDETS